MILKSPKIEQAHFTRHIPVIKAWIPRPLQTACGHGEIKPDESYIHSKATGRNYCDMVCLCEEEGIEYSNGRRQEIKEMYEVEMYG